MQVRIKDSWCTHIPILGQLGINETPWGF
jgi:hypothetical protein